MSIVEAWLQLISVFNWQWLHKLTLEIILLDASNLKTIQILICVCSSVYSGIEEKLFYSGKH